MEDLLSTLYSFVLFEHVFLFFFLFLNGHGLHPLIIEFRRKGSSSFPNGLVCCDGHTASSMVECGIERLD